MYIDKDLRGKFSIQDLSEEDLRFFHEALRVYAQRERRCLLPEDNFRRLFNNEFKFIMRHGE